MKKLSSFLSFFLILLFVFPSVYMVHIGKVSALEYSTPSVGNLASTGVDIIQCNLGGVIASVLGSWLPFLGSGAVAAKTTAAEVKTNEEILNFPTEIAAAGTTYATLYPLTVPINDGPGFVQNEMINKRLLTIVMNTNSSALSNANINKETSAVTFKNCILDPLARMAKQMVIDAITDSLLAWIEGGFEGSPSFITNPGEFFRTVGRQAISTYLFERGLDKFLCEPFRVDVILNFLWDYERPARSEYGSLSCSLEDIFSQGVVISVSGRQGSGRGNTIENDTRSPEDRMRAFTKGDFNAGGFPAFFAMLRPSGNAYDQEVHLKADLKAQENKAIAEEKETTSYGEGFLSQRCDSTGDGKMDHICTPGAYITGQVDQVMGGALTDLQLANSFGAILDALLKYVITEILEGASGEYGLLRVQR
jgi:hypothetical protein